MPPVIANENIGNDVIANVTCPICQNLFTSPKMMPACLHTFCLGCLQSVPIEKKSLCWKVKCPECHTESKISGHESERSVDNFKANVIVENIVGAIKSKTNSSKSSCGHPSDEFEFCVHCQRDLCQKCCSTHIEELKSESLELCKKTIDSTLIKSKKKTLKQIDQFINDSNCQAEKQIQSAIESAKASFAATIKKQVVEIRSRLAILKTEQTQAMQSAVHVLVNSERVNELSETRKSISEESSKTELADIANFYLDLTERRKSAEYLDEILKMEPSALFKFELDREVENFVESFEAVNFGALQLNRKAETIKAFFERASMGIDVEKEENKMEQDDATEMSDNDESVEKIGKKRSPKLSKKRRITSESEEDAEMDTMDDAGPKADNTLPYDEESASDEEGESSFVTTDTSMVEDAAVEGDCEEEEELEEEEVEDSDYDKCSSSSSQALEVNGEQEELVVDSVLKDTRRIVMKDANAVVALPSKGLFGFVQENTTFNLVSPTNARIVKKYAFSFPISVTSFDTYEVATDDRDCVVINAEVEISEVPKKSDDKDNMDCSTSSSSVSSSRRIYRFWLGERDLAHLHLFAIAKDSEDFNGIAVSKKWGYVFTTEGNSVIALASVGFGRSRMARRILKIDVGPDPFVHSIFQNSDDRAHLICSSEFNVVDKILKMKDDGSVHLKKDKRWRHADVEDLKTVWPGLFGVWDENVVVSKGYWLKRFCDFPENAQNVGSFAPAYNPSEPLECFKALAVMRCAAEKKPGSWAKSHDYVALINDSDKVVVAVLPKDGCCLSVVE